MSSKLQLPPELDLPEFDKFEKDWMKRGIFLVPGEIDKEWHKKVVWPTTRACLSGCDQPLVFLINSPGGYTQTAWQVINVLNSYLGPTVGIVVGQAASAAFSILQACKYRFCVPGSTGLIHSASKEFELTMFNEAEAVATIRRLADQSREVFKSLSARNPLVTARQLEEQAQVNMSFPLTVESGWVDAVIQRLYPLHPLPDEWQRKIFGETPTQ